MSDQVGFPDFFGQRIVEYSGLIQVVHDLSLIITGAEKNINIVTDRPGQVITGSIQIQFSPVIEKMRCDVELDLLDFPLFRIFGTDVSALVYKETSFIKIRAIDREQNMVWLTIDKMPPFLQRARLYIKNEGTNQITVDSYIYYYDYSVT